MHVKAKGLKVLHVIPSVATCRGGPSKAVLEMVLNLRILGIDAEIATTNDDGLNDLEVSLNKLIDYKGVPVRFFKRASPPISAIREFSYSSSFTRWLRRHITDYDVVHVHALFSYCSSVAMFLARKRAVPYLVRPIGQLQSWSLQQAKVKKSLYLRAVEKANLESANAVHFTSQAEQLEANQQFDLAGHVIPLGVDFAERSTLRKEQLLQHFAIAAEGNRFIVLYLSRLHHKKGLELLMQALSRIDDTAFSLLIAGDGEVRYKKNLSRLSRQLRIAEKCHFLGHVDGQIKDSLLHHSDLYALTSFSENFGISVLEAMATGLPPLISDGVALSKVVGDHKLGLVCSIDVKQIETALRYAFANQKELKAMAERSHRYTKQHFSWPSISKQLKSLYLSLTTVDDGPHKES